MHVATYTLLHPLTASIISSSTRTQQTKSPIRFFAQFHNRSIVVFTAIDSPKPYPDKRISESMVKLASARDVRLYGPRLSRNRAEHTNAGLYLFATVVLLGGFVAQLSKEPKSGLVLLLIAFALIMIVNLHDLFAHLAGIDYSFSLMGYDTQVALVEFAAPLVQALGSLLLFLAALFLFIQEEKNYDNSRLEQHALNMLIAGSALWVLGSIHNSCQIYERADGHVQILQQSVYIPFLIGSVLFLIGSILNEFDQAALSLHHGLDLLSWTWVWLGVFGSLIFFIGGFANVVKVFKMQQTVDGLRLEKLRGGAHERLLHERDGRIPLILEDERRRSSSRQSEEEAGRIVNPNPYKDAVLISQA